MLPASFAAQAPEFDLGRVVFIIMVILGGFIQWLSNWWKKKRAEAAAMRQSPSTPEEMQAREKAWREQTGAGNLVAPQPAARNPLEDLLKTFREFAAPGIEVPPVVIQAPPKLPASPRIGVPAPVASRGVEIHIAPVAIVRKRERHPLAVRLAASGGLRQAVVLREILGPPKALQSGDDHLI